MAYSVDQILSALRATRQRKGLSQAELGRRVGLPQSHISQIEKGGSDLKLSSLIEIARALDFDVKLIPRGAVPAVESLTKAVADETDATSRALNQIWRADQIARALERAPALQPHLAAFRNGLEELARFRFRGPDAAALIKALEPIDRVRKRFDQLGLPAERLGNLASAYVAPITASTLALKNLRNDLAHARSAPEDRQLPAYRLDDEDE